MRAAFSAALDAEPPEVRHRVTLRAGSAGSLAGVTGGESYDALLLLGVLMYLPASVRRERHHAVCPPESLSPRRADDLRVMAEQRTDLLVRGEISEVGAEPTQLGNIDDLVAGL